MTNISKDQIKRLAELSRLHLGEKEIENLQIDLQAIIGYFEKLETVKTEELEPTSQVTGLMDVWRSDAIIDYGVTPDELLKNAPAIEDHQFKVERVL